MRTPLIEIISRRYLKSLVYANFYRKDFGSIRTYCMFIGYQRSGHSFIGALLDAHPNAVMGMEVDALNLLQLGYSREQIYYCLRRNSEVFKKRLNNTWTGYSYAVPGQFQGSYTQLQMIGDKKGGRSTLRIGEDPQLLDKLKAIIGIPVRILHVIRNPYDIISTMIRRAEPPSKITGIDYYRHRMENYFDKVHINAGLRKRQDLDILDVYHESFVSDPRGTMERILDFVDLPKHEDYISACAEKVYDEPHLSRFKLEWPQDMKEEIFRRYRQVDYLKHYRFDEPSGRAEN